MHLFYVTIDNLNKKSFKNNKLHIDLSINKLKINSYVLNLIAFLNDYFNISKRNALDNRVYFALY
jgi:hypothetical protein